MKIKRDIASTPQRTADATWQAVQTLVTGKGAVDSKQLEDASGVMMSLITDEIYTGHPLTFVGVGPRLVIYMRHKFDALEAGDNIEPIDWVPTAGDWRLYVPCDDANFEWVKKSLGMRASRFIVHRLGESPDEEESEQKNNAQPLQINWEGLGR